MDQTALRTRRSQAERRDQSGHALLIAAAEVIERDGIAAATFEAVGRQSGYSRGLASARFGSKDAMVRAVIGFLAERLAARMDERFAAEPGPMACIMAFSDVMLTAVEEDPLLRAYFVMMAGAVGHRSPLQAEFLSTHDDVRHQLRTLIEAGQRLGEIDTSLDANAVALSIGSINLGISVELLLDPAMDMTAMRSTVRTAVMRLLAVV